MAEEKVFPAGTEVKQISSGMLSLNLRDLGKGLLTAAISSSLTALYQLISTSPMVLDWSTMKPVLLVGVTSGIAYLLKNLFTDAKVVVPNT